MEEQIAKMLYDYANSLFEHRGFCKTLLVEYPDKDALDGHGIELVKTFKVKATTLAGATRNWMKLIDAAGWAEVMGSIEGQDPINLERDRLDEYKLGIVWRRYPEVKGSTVGPWIITSRQIITNNPAVRGFEMEA